METNTETVKKTPGDIKREELAGRLGEGWKFFSNYPVCSRKSVEYGKEGVGKITTDLDRQIKAGQIEDWRAEQKAFQDDGQETPFDMGRSAYIKPKAQVK